MAEALAVVLAGGRPTLQNQGVPTLEFYPFRFRDPLTGRWVRARYKAQVPVLQRCYVEREITGPPEIRYVTPASAERFSPFKLPAPPLLSEASR